MIFYFKSILFLKFTFSPLRTYLRRTAGSVQSLFFSPDSGLFVGVFILDTSLSYPTEIYLNEDLNYAKGFEIKITSSMSWTKPSKNMIYLFPSMLAQNKQRVEVIITRK